MRIRCVLALMLVVAAGGVSNADFTEPVEVSVEDIDYDAPDIAIDSVDNVSIIYNSGDQLFLATTLVGLGDEEVEVTDSTGEATGGRIATGELGLLHVVYALESTSTGAAGNDIVLIDNSGGVFDTSDELAATDEDESDPQIDVVLGTVHAVWNLIPDGSEPEVYYSYDSGAGILVETGKEPRVAVSSDEHAHVIYQREGDVHYRRYDVDLDSLADEVNVSDMAGTESEYGIAVDSDDVIHVIFLNGDALFHTDNGSGDFSEAEEVHAGPLEEVVLATGPAGEVAVVFVDSVGLLQFMELTETGFSDPETVADTLDAREPETVFDSEGFLHVVYVEEDSVFYTNGVPRPSVDFAVDETTGETPLTVQFTNLTDGVVSEYLWSFGDGNTSTDSDPVHTYTELGTHTVRLTATGPGGTSSRTRLSYVRVEEATNILRLPDIAVYPGESITHPIYGTSTNPLQGFTVFLQYDDSRISVDEVTFEGSVTDVLEPEFIIITDEPDGADSRIRIAVLIDFETPLDGRTIDEGEDLVLVSVEYVVPSDLEVGDATDFEFINEGTDLNVFSASSDDGVFSVVAAHVQGGYEVTTLETDGRFIRGDVNGNGSLSLADAIATLLWMFESGDEPDCLDAADFDDNESITLLDVVQFLQHVFQRGAAPDYPYPALGLDPAGDELGCDF